MREYLGRRWRAFQPHLKETPARFPLPFACALAFTVVLSLGIHDFWPLDGLEARILWFCVIGFFLLLAVHLLGEARDWPPALSWPIALAAGGLLAWRIGAADLDSIWSGGINFFLAPACVLAVMSAPFATARLSGSHAAESQAADLAIWHFNRLAWFGCGFAFLVGLVLGGGLSGAFWALEALFGLPVEEELYGDVWTLSMGLLTPWLALAAVPRSFAAPEAPVVPRPIVFLATYILVPLAIGYFAILTAFMVKIAVQWSLPRGEVATLIMSYAAFGVAAHLIACPLRDSGVAHVRAFHRWFYPALLVPAVLLALAIFVRVEAYGVTEDRYLVMAFAAWLLLLAPFMTIRPRSGLVVAPLGLAALLTLGAFGPWGAESLSLSSQMGRLERLLTGHGLLKDGRIAAAPAEVPTDDVVRISSIVLYLRDSGKHVALAPWFEESALDFATGPYANEIVEAMGLTFMLQPNVLPGFHFYAQITSALGDVRGFDLLGRVQIYAYGDTWETVLADEATQEVYGLAFDPENGRFTIVGPDGETLAFDLNAFVQSLSDRGLTGPVEDFHLERTDSRFRVRLIFQELSGTRGSGGPRIQAGQIRVLIDRGEL